MQGATGRGALPQRVDVIILGGGINGVALARECALAGRSVLLLERHDFASGATCRGTRVVHGGLHFLEQGELGMLRDGLRGRDTLLREQPHLVQPLDFVLAAAPNSRYSALEVRAALWLYRKLGNAGSPATNLDALRGTLDAAQRWSLFAFQDAHCDFPERLVADWLLDACARGTIARNHAEVLAIRASEGRVRGVMVRDSLTAEDTYVESEWVINAGGPWVDRVRDLTGLASRSPLVSNVRCTHLMLRRWQGAPEAALLATPGNGRPVFIAPWNGMVQVGSTCVAYTGDPTAAMPSAEELRFLLQSTAALFPRARLTGADVVFSYSGVLPMAYRSGERQRNASDAFATGWLALHNHADEGALGMLSIFGGTLTTAAALAQRTARTMGLRSGRMTKKRVAAGEANGLENTLQQWSSAVHGATGIPPESAEAIARWHGRHAMCVVQAAVHDPRLRQPILDGRPQLLAQAAEAAEYEHAVSLADILLRRVPMALDRDWNDEATKQAASRIALVLGWSERRMRDEIEAFEMERGTYLHKPKNLKPDGVAA